MKKLTLATLTATLLVGCGSSDSDGCDIHTCPVEPTPPVSEPTIPSVADWQLAEDCSSKFRDCQLWQWQLDSEHITQVVWSDDLLIDQTTADQVYYSETLEPERITEVQYTAHDENWYEFRWNQSYDYITREQYKNGYEVIETIQYGGRDKFMVQYNYVRIADCYSDLQVFKCDVYDDGETVRTVEIPVTLGYAIIDSTDTSNRLHELFRYLK